MQYQHILDRPSEGTLLPGLWKLALFQLKVLALLIADLHADDFGIPQPADALQIDTAGQAPAAQIQQDDKGLPPLCKSPGDCSSPTDLSSSPTKLPLVRFFLVELTSFATANLYIPSTLVQSSVSVISLQSALLYVAGVEVHTSLIDSASIWVFKLH